MNKKIIKRDSDILALIASGMVKEVLSHSEEKYSDADVILLNDGETYILLEEQDYYSYHDCASSARHIDVRKSKEEWKCYLELYFPAHSLT